MKSQTIVRVVVVSLVCFAAGCKSLAPHDDSKFIEGPPVEEVVSVMQNAMDRVMASDARKPFEKESDDWASKCDSASTASEQACALAQDAAFDACASLGNASAVVVAETCKRVFAGDRTVCHRPSTKEMSAWCKLVEPTADCQKGKKQEAVMCSASKAAPRLTLVSAKIVANVVHSDAHGGSIGLAIVSFEGSHAVARSSSIEIELALRPVDEGPQPSTEVFKIRTWSPVEPLRRSFTIERGRPAKIDHSADNIVDTVVAALRATSANFSQQDKPRVVPLRPRTFTFEFAFEATDKQGVGVDIDLAPAPIKLGANASRETNDGNKLVLVFGPDPGAQ